MNKKDNIVKMATPGVTGYCPEMGEREPQGADFYSSLSHYGSHHYLYSNKIVLKGGQGIQVLNDSEKFKYVYRVTDRQYRILSLKYRIVSKYHLD